eukprot:g28834.t1
MSGEPSLARDVYSAEAPYTVSWLKLTLPRALNANPENYRIQWVHSGASILLSPVASGVTSGDQEQIHFPSFSSSSTLYYSSKYLLSPETATLRLHRRKSDPDPPYDLRKAVSSPQSLLSAGSSAAQGMEEDWEVMFNRRNCRFKRSLSRSRSALLSRSRRASRSTAELHTSADNPSMSSSSDLEHLSFDKENSSDSLFRSSSFIQSAKPKLSRPAAAAEEPIGPELALVGFEPVGWTEVSLQGLIPRDPAEGCLESASSGQEICLHMQVKAVPKHKVTAGKGAGSGSLTGSFGVGQQEPEQNLSEKKRLCEVRLHFVPSLDPPRRVQDKRLMKFISKLNLFQRTYSFNTQPLWLGPTGKQKQQFLDLDPTSGISDVFPAEHLAMSVVLSLHGKTKSVWSEASQSWAGGGFSWKEEESPVMCLDRGLVWENKTSRWRPKPSLILIRLGLTQEILGYAVLGDHETAALLMGAPADKLQCVFTLPVHMLPSSLHFTHLPWQLQLRVSATSVETGLTSQSLTEDKFELVAAGGRLVALFQPSDLVCVEPSVSVRVTGSDTGLAWPVATLGQSAEHVMYNITDKAHLLICSESLFWGYQEPGKPRQEQKKVLVAGGQARFKENERIVWTLREEQSPSSNLLELEHISGRCALQFEFETAKACRASHCIIWSCLFPLVPYGQRAQHSSAHSAPRASEKEATAPGEETANSTSAGGIVTERKSAAGRSVLGGVRGALNRLASSGTGTIKSLAALVGGMSSMHADRLHLLAAPPSVEQLQMSLRLAENFPPDALANFMYRLLNTPYLSWRFLPNSLLSLAPDLMSPDPLDGLPFQQIPGLPSEGLRTFEQHLGQKYGRRAAVAGLPEADASRVNLLYALVTTQVTHSTARTIKKSLASQQLPHVESAREGEVDVMHEETKKVAEHAFAMFYSTVYSPSTLSSSSSSSLMTKRVTSDVHRNSREEPTADKDTPQVLAQDAFDPVSTPPASGLAQNSSAGVQSAPPVRNRRGSAPDGGLTKQAALAFNQKMCRLDTSLLPASCVNKLTEAWMEDFVTTALPFRCRCPSVNEKAGVASLESSAQKNCGSGCPLDVLRSLMASGARDVLYSFATRWLCPPAQAADPKPSLSMKPNNIQGAGNTGEAGANALRMIWLGGHLSMLHFFDLCPSNLVVCARTFPPLVSAPLGQPLISIDLVGLVGKSFTVNISSAWPISESPSPTPFGESAATEQGNQALALTNQTKPERSMATESTCQMLQGSPLNWKQIELEIEQGGGRDRRKGGVLADDQRPFSVRARRNTSPALTSPTRRSESPPQASNKQLLTSSSFPASSLSDPSVSLWAPQTLSRSFTELLSFASDLDALLPNDLPPNCRAKALSLQHESVASYLKSLGNKETLAKVAMDPRATLLTRHFLGLHDIEREKQWGPSLFSQVIRKAAMAHRAARSLPKEVIIVLFEVLMGKIPLLQKLPEGWDHSSRSRRLSLESVHPNHAPKDSTVTPSHKPRHRRASWSLVQQTEEKKSQAQPINSDVLDTGKQAIHAEEECDEGSISLVDGKRWRAPQLVGLLLDCMMSCSDSVRGAVWRQLTFLLIGDELNVFALASQTNWMPRLTELMLLEEAQSRLTAPPRPIQPDRKKELIPAAPSAEEGMPFAIDSARMVSSLSFCSSLASEESVPKRDHEPQLAQGIGSASFSFASKSQWHQSNPGASPMSAPSSSAAAASARFRYAMLCAVLVHYTLCTLPEDEDLRAEAWTELLRTHVQQMHTTQAEAVLHEASAKASPSLCSTTGSVDATASAPPAGKPVCLVEVFLKSLMVKLRSNLQLFQSSFLHGAWNRCLSLLECLYEYCMASQVMYVLPPLDPSLVPDLWACLEQGPGQSDAIRGTRTDQLEPFSSPAPSPPSLSIGSSSASQAQLPSPSSLTSSFFGSLSSQTGSDLPSSFSTSRERSSRMYVAPSRSFSSSFSSVRIPTPRSLVNRHSEPPSPRTGGCDTLPSTELLMMNQKEQYNTVLRDDTEVSQVPTNLNSAFPEAEPHEKQGSNAAAHNEHSSFKNVPTPAYPGPILTHQLRPPSATISLSSFLPSSSLATYSQPFSSHSWESVDARSPMPPSAPSLTKLSSSPSLPALPSTARMQRRAGSKVTSSTKQVMPIPQTNQQLVLQTAPDTAEVLTSTPPFSRQRRTQRNLQRPSLSPAPPASSPVDSSLPPLPSILSPPADLASPPPAPSYYFSNAPQPVFSQPLPPPPSSVQINTTPPATSLPSAELYVPLEPLFISTPKSSSFGLVQQSVPCVFAMPMPPSASLAVFGWLCLRKARAVAPEPAPARGVATKASTFKYKFVVLQGARLYYGSTRSAWKDQNFLSLYKAQILGDGGLLTLREGKTLYGFELQLDWGGSEVTTHVNPNVVTLACEQEATAEHWLKEVNNTIVRTQMVDKDLMQPKAPSPMAVRERIWSYHLSQHAEALLESLQLSKISEATLGSQASKEVKRVRALKKRAHVLAQGFKAAQERMIAHAVLHRRDNRTKPTPPLSIHSDNQKLQVMFLE